MLLIWLASPCWIKTKHAKCHSVMHMALTQRETDHYKPMLKSHSNMNLHTQIRCSWVCDRVPDCEHLDCLCWIGLCMMRKRMGTDWFSAVTSPLTSLGPHLWSFQAWVPLGVPEHSFRVQALDPVPHIWARARSLDVHLQHHVFGCLPLLPNEQVKHPFP